MVVRLIDIGFDPFVGMAMDRTRTPIGRYRPWVIAGTPILMFALYKLCLPDPGVGLGYMVLWLVVLYGGNSMFVLGQSAWGAVLATDYHQRTRTYAWSQAFGVASSMALLLLPLLTHNRIQPGRHESMAPMGWLLIASLPLSLLATLVLTPERITPRPAHQHLHLKDFAHAIARPEMRRLILADLTLSFGTGLTGPIYIFFFHDAKGFGIPATASLLVFYIGAGLFGSPFWAGVAAKIGKHKVVQVACVTYALAQAVLMMLPKAVYLPTAAAMFAVGFCAAAFVPMIRAMVADIGDEIRYESGKDVISVLYSMVTTTAKVGQATAIGVVLPVLGFVGYNAAENAVNTPGAIFGLEMCYLFAPVFFVAIGGLTMFGYGLNGDRHAQIRTELNARDAMAVETLEPASAEQSLTGPVTPRVA
jgi:Na+/melibiose symporter-like transporter